MRSRFENLRRLKGKHGKPTRLMSFCLFMKLEREEDEGIERGIMVRHL